MGRYSRLSELSAEECVPDFPIIDSHVHLYDLQKLSYAWMAGVPQLAHTTTMVDFDQARENIAIERLVFVEVDVDAGLHLDEARYVNSLAKSDPRIGAIIAHAPVHNGKAVEADLAALAEMPLVKGVRRLIQQEADPSLILSQDFIDGVRLLPKYGMSFDVCIKHFQLAYTIELIRKCPEVYFVLDHCAKPDIRHGMMEPWKSQLRELARLPNVVCKLSGIVTEADHRAWTRDQLRPYIHHVIDTFGFDRLMFGSDWTVATLAIAYPAWVELLDDEIRSASGAEKQTFWQGTAKKAYRLP
jgi:L-fuconolactonase